MNWAHRKIELGQIKLVENLWRKQPPTIMTDEEITTVEREEKSKGKTFLSK